MIGYLKGKVKAKTNKTLLLEVAGVGYSIFTTPTLLQQLKLDEEAELYIHTHVREDALELYGLTTLEEIEFFKQMISISGVGPKSALGIFEVAKVKDIKNAIAAGDPSLLTKVSGIGKKTAELIIIKLKDKSVELADLAGGSSAHGEALEALIGLGYPAVEVRTILNSLDANLESAEDKVKAALKLLAKK